MGIRSAFIGSFVVFFQSRGSFPPQIIAHLILFFPISCTDEAGNRNIHTACF